ncbi:SRPBCC family protein [Intrasporangium flavum]|uniref:SRPBCC family protein n=1 Tax=Intrasporangium flavum TaxID=1428657 RepID=UPI00096C03AD|nr:SRPBCC family protein [Intrasporangium flavum]
MHQATSIDVDTDAAHVWAVITDVERWPEWTDSVTSLHLLDPAPLRVGSRALIEQPRLPRTQWTVTSIDEGREFVWEATGPGVHTVARHGVEPLDAGRSRATLSISQEGWLGSLVGRVYRGLTERYLSMEAAGLKARSEDASTS